jgi:site-specific DNA-cytosine methylase
MKSPRKYKAFFPFGGAAGGALGFQQAEVSVMGQAGRFEVVGGFDFDKEACADFEYLTGVPEACVDVTALEPADVRRIAGEEAPDVVFLSPPCKGASGLLSEEKAASPKYSAMNELALVWTRLMLAAWSTPPRLVLLENVPRLKSRAGKMLREIRRLLRAAGYVLSDGFHDCGELGGLAQHRRRYLLVARHRERVPPLLYQPPKRRVRACGEVLGPLPMPEDPAGGPMHRLPRISWLNWVRLALIPAGGDWRDLPGVLAKDEERREKFKRHKVEDFAAPVGTVGGSGSNGVENVADPRPGGWGGGALGVNDWKDPTGAVIGESLPPNGKFSVADARMAMPSCKDGSYHNNYRVEGWDAPAHTVTGATRPGSGAPSIADSRVVPKSGFAHCYRITRWNRPAGTVTSSPAPSSGAGAVNDPRSAERFRGYLGIIPWKAPAGTVTGSGRPGNGKFAVADPRVSNAFDHGYMVLPWSAPSPTVAGKSHPGNGAFSVGDPRLECTPRSGAYGVIDWREAAGTITGAACFDNGRFAIQDPRTPDAPPIAIIEDVRKPPPGVPLIIAEDGTWHRPLTTLELAVLQGFPAEVNGQPLKLTGTRSSAWRERIGNAVPPPAARAIAERMLFALLQADYEAFALAGPDTPVWVTPRAEVLHG